VGATLWFLVAVFAFSMLQNRNPKLDSRQNGNTISDTDVKAGDVKDKSTNGESGGSQIIPPEEIWDPEGVDNFELLDVDGKTVTKSDLLGKPWVVSFIFTRCVGTCPAITASVRKLAAQTKEVDVRFVSISVDPNYDTPAILKKYAAEHGAEKSRWLFLTGDQRAIYQLIYKSFKLPVKEITGESRQPGFEVLHSNFVLHVNATGRVVQKYDGTKEAEMVRLRRKLMADQKVKSETELKEENTRPKSDQAEPKQAPELETRPSPPQLPMVVEP